MNLSRIESDTLYSPVDDKGGCSFPWLWLGTWSLGGEGFGRVDLGESVEVIKKAFHAGIRHFDTAPLYAHGKSEMLLKKALAKKRTRIFISSKGGLEWRGRNVIHDASPQALRRSLEQSLRRLKTDYLDLYQLHWPDPGVPLAESLDALKGFRQEGLIRFWGVGNLAPDQVRGHLPPGGRIPHQVHFSPIHRDFEVLKAGYEEGRACNCVTSPLEQGLLGSGQSKDGLANLGKKDIRRRNSYFYSEIVLNWTRKFHLLCKEKALSPVNVTITWILTRPYVEIVVCGPKNMVQLQELLDHKKLLEKVGLAPGRHQHDLEEGLKDLLGTDLYGHVSDGLL